MLKKLVYLMWFSFPLTKLVYAYVGFSRGMPSSDAYPPILVILFFLSVLCIAGGQLLYRNIYTNRQFYDSKVVRLLAPDGIAARMAPLEQKLYVLFTLALGLTETCAIFGLVGFFQTGNVQFFVAMLSICILSWALQYPRLAAFEQNVLGQSGGQE